jgi:large subunit ribosomal protein L7/L12
MTSQIDKIVEEIQTLTLSQTVDLIKKLEEVFEIDSSALIAPPQFFSGLGASQSAPVAAPIVEEKTTFNLLLDEVPADKKIAILKIVRNVTGLGLKESKDIVDNTPKILKENISKEEAETIKKDLEGAGAKVSLK